MTAGNNLLAKVSVAFGAVFFGTVVTLDMKWMYQTESMGVDGKEKPFKKPWFMVFAMFLGMSLTLCLFMLQMLMAKRQRVKEGYVSLQGNPATSERTFSNMSTFGVLWRCIFPACCDMMASGLNGVGFLFVAASVLSICRGANIMFTALFSVFFLKRRLTAYECVIKVQEPSKSGRTKQGSQGERSVCTIPANTITTTTTTTTTTSSTTTTMPPFSGAWVRGVQGENCDTTCGGQCLEGYWPTSTEAFKDMLDKIGEKSCTRSEAGDWNVNPAIYLDYDSVCQWAPASGNVGRRCSYQHFAVARFCPCRESPATTTANPTAAATTEAANQQQQQK